MDLVQSVSRARSWSVIYDGKVVKVVDFGAFVNFFGPKRDGLVHVSQLANRAGSRPARPMSSAKAKTSGSSCMGFDDRGKVRLSMKVVNQETGKEMTAEENAAG